MMNFSNKNILILTDFSDVALNAAMYAATLSRQLNVPKILVYYSDYIPSTVDVPLQNAIRQEHELKKNEERLKGLKSKLELLTNGQTPVSICIDERPLDLAVDELGQTESIGLVVMGIKGKGRLEQTLIGSNTITIARTCHIPLLIVPEEAIFGGISKIVFAAELKEVTDTIPYQTINNFIEAINAKLLVLNVDKYEEHQFNPETKAEEEGLRSQFGDDASFHYSHQGDVATGIARFAEEQETDLIIAVPKEYGFFKGLFHRSLTKKMIYHTHIPLLLIKT
jgi:nucleotide-binding universal stress UspA family protein